MATGYNMPDGVTESMIPGYNDIEVSLKFECETDDCLLEWEEDDCTVDPRVECRVDAVCPNCGAATFRLYHHDEAEREKYDW
jgi:hypothetical protein